MQSDFLFHENIWLIASVFLFLLMVCGELGYRLAGRHHPDADDPTRAQFSNIQNGIIGLLALLLAFSFSMAVNRFQERKQMVVTETNSIGTTWLRAQALPEPQGAATRALLIKYVDARIAYSKAGVDPARIAAAERDTVALQGQLWTLALALAAREDKAYPFQLYTVALNDTIDMSARRLAVMNDHVPETVLWMLMLVSSVTLLTVGYGFGLGRRRSTFSLLALSLLIVLVVVLMLDFDRPRRGLILVSENDFAALRGSMSPK
jgi:hypothetical protein